MRPSHSNPSTSHFALAQTSLLVLFFLTVAEVGASAQIDRAELEGTVTDAAGRVIVGASVKILAVDTGIAQEHNANSVGYYRFPGLPVGHYSVMAYSKGFRTSVVGDIELQRTDAHA